MSPLRRVGSVFVILGLLFILAAPAVSNSGGAPAGGEDAATATEVGDEPDPTAGEVAPIEAESTSPLAPITSQRDTESACPSGQARVDQGNHLGQCVAAPADGEPTPARDENVAPLTGELAAQTTVKRVVIQIVQRSCEVRDGVSETNVTFSFRHNGLNTSGKIEMTINGPTGLIVISQKTEFELPEGTYRWTARSIDSEHEIDGPSSGVLIVLACLSTSTTTTTTPTSSTTTTTVPVSATTITSPTTTITSTTSSSTTSTSTTSASTTSASTTSSSTTSTTVPTSECEPPDCLPYTGPADEYWPMAIFGAVLMISGMAALTMSRVLEDRQEQLLVE